MSKKSKPLNLERIQREHYRKHTIGQIFSWLDHCGKCGEFWGDEGCDTLRLLNELYNTRNQLEDERTTYRETLAEISGLVKQARQQVETLKADLVGIKRSQKRINGLQDHLARCHGIACDFMYDPLPLPPELQDEEGFDNGY